MPFRSQAQRRYFHWAVGQKKITPKTVKEWEEHTPKGKKLPERVGKEKRASDVMMEAFFDELQKIGEVEKDAIFGTIARGAGKAFAGLRTGLGKALTGAGQKIMPKVPVVPKGPTWTMGAKELSATPGSAWSSIIKGKTQPVGGGFQRAGERTAFRPVEQTAESLATKQKTIANLKARGIAVPGELQSELAIPVAKGIVPKGPIASANIPPRETTAVQPITKLSPKPKPFMSPQLAGAAE